MGNEIYFMGIDIGTYTGKGVITDSHGKVAARLKSPTEWKIRPRDSMSMMRRQFGGMISAFCQIP